MIDRLLLTGASRGIGRAIAVAVAPHAKQVVIVGRSRASLSEVASLNPSAFDIAECDLSEPLERAKLLTWVAARPEPFDGFVHCAGDGEPDPIQEIRSDTLRRLFELHVVAPMEIAQTLLPSMRETKNGRIIAIGSLAALRPRRMMGAYGATKAALRTLIKSIADEVIADGVTANLVTPGGVDTALARRGRSKLERMQGQPEGSEIASRLAQLPPSGQLTPDEIVGAVLFLLGPASRAISGQEIVVAGTTLI